MKDKSIIGMAAVIHYNANVFTGYDFSITPFTNSVENAKDWFSRGEHSHFARIQDVVFPIGFNGENGTYFYELDQNKYPKRDTNGHWICSSCLEPKSWFETKCCEI